MDSTAESHSIDLEGTGTLLFWVENLGDLEGLRLKVQRN